MPKYTPAPWVVGRYAMSVEGKTSKGTIKICDIRGWGHLTGQGHGALGLDQDEAIKIQTANAQLIAAAPELLEALQDLLSVVAVRIDDQRIKQFDKARAAIAKATAEVSDV